MISRNKKMKFDVAVDVIMKITYCIVMTLCAICFVSLTYHIVLGGCR